MSEVQLETKKRAKKDVTNKIEDKPASKPTSTKKIKGTAKIKKTPFWGRFISEFVVNDLGVAKDYVISEILVPYSKKIIKEVLDSTLDSIFYGRRAPRSSYGSYGSYSSYSSYSSYNKYDTPSPYGESYSSSRRYSRPYSDLGCIVMRDREDAVTCLDCMNDTIAQYGTVTVADVYDYIGVQSRYTDRDYGWTQLNNARIEGTRDGFALILPQPRPLPKDN